MLLRGVALSCVLALCSAVTWRELGGYTFDDYVREFGKGYARGTAEHASREAIFLSRMAEIAAHNSRQSTWKEGVNRFTDWSYSEIKAILGYRKVWRACNSASYTHTTRTTQ